MSIGNCPRCGGECDDDNEYCLDCRIQDIYDHVVGDLLNDDDEIDGSPMCVMCGKEWGTSKRKDGKYYCGHCWMVWTS